MTFKDPERKQQWHRDYRARVKAQRGLRESLIRYDTAQSILKEEEMPPLSRGVMPVEWRAEEFHGQFVIVKDDGYEPVYFRKTSPMCRTPFAATKFSSVELALDTIKSFNQQPTPVRHKGEF